MHSHVIKSVIKCHTDDSLWQQPFRKPPLGMARPQSMSFSKHEGHIRLVCAQGNCQGGTSAERSLHEIRFWTYEISDEKCSEFSLNFLSL